MYTHTQYLMQHWPAVFQLEPMIMWHLRTLKKANNRLTMMYGEHHVRRILLNLFMFIQILKN